VTRLLLARHGQTERHQTDRFLGATDVPLSDIGLRQVEYLSQHLVGERIDAIYTSPLSRARTTAEIVAAAHGLPVNLRDALRECDFGVAEGLTFPEIEQQYPALAKELLAWRAVIFPGGESLGDLDRRLIPFAEEMEKHGENETVLIVAHGGPLRLLICRWLGLGIDDWLKFRLDLASLSIVEIYEQGSILCRLNDTSYLKE
jgi:alpha-ribazole phosphatase